MFACGCPFFSQHHLLVVLFLAALGLAVSGASSPVAVCGSCGGLSCVEHGPQGAVGCSSCGAQAHSCGARAGLLCGMWDLPRSGIKPLSPALAGRFLPTEPPGKPLNTTYGRDCPLPSVYSCQLCHRVIDHIGMDLEKAMAPHSSTLA